MTPDEHLYALGKLLVNLHALEMSLRAFLVNRSDARLVHQTYGTDILTLPIGSVLPESDLTTHAYLSDLVKQFNEVAAKKGSSTIDAGVIEVRNTLVHGCVFGREASFPVHILKFSKASSGEVKILTSEKMTADWFAQQHRTIVSALQIVRENLDSEEA